MGQALTELHVPRNAEFEVARLVGDGLVHHWPAIAGEMEKVAEVWNTWWTVEALQDAAFSGRMQVWTAGDATAFHIVVFTQILYYPANTVLQLVLALGNSLDEAMPVLNATLEKFAAMNGCGVAEIIGRPGWERKLREVGFRKKAVVLTKRLGAFREQ